MADEILTSTATASPGRVVLLHGLARRRRSMAPLARTLERVGYDVANIGYPSRHHPVAVLAREHVGPAIRARFPEDGAPIHLVTHSLGGIVLRWLVRDGLLPDVGRVVMLAPPNQGSEVVDRIGHWGLFQWVNGPAGRELGTGPEALPARLGPATFPCGIIAGDRSVDLPLAWCFDGPNDGKVAVARARLAGMADFRVVHASHPFVMRSAQVQDLVLSFLACGGFEAAPGVPPAEG